MLLGLYTTDTTDTLDRARLAPAAELPPAFSAAFDAAYTETRAFANSDALWRARHEAVQKALDAFEDATGEALQNPEAAAPGPNREALERFNQQRFDQIGQERPDLKLAYPTDEQRQQAAIEVARAARKERGRVDALPGTFASGAGSIIGDVAGAMTDPLNLATMVFGAGASSGILRTMAVEAGIGAASQAVIEAGTAGFKRQVDPATGLPEAIGNIAAAGAGGAIIGGGVKAVGELVGKLRGRTVPREVQDALNVTERDAEVRAANPLGSTVTGEQAHFEALKKASQDLEAGRPVDVSSIVAEARAAEEPARLDLPQPANDTSGPPRVFTSAGRAVDVEYRVVEADTLVTSHGADGTVNPAFPPDLQPRDRTRLASQTQIAEMAGQLQPERLGRSADAATGAPIIGPDMVVESGNGRIAAIRTAYDQGGDAAARYREWVASQDPTAAGMQRPVLVAVRKTELDPAGRLAFTREANQATAARLSPTEMAIADARLLDGAALSRLSGGDVTSAGNRPFVRTFLDRLPPSERGSLVDAAGALNQEGKKRLEGALLGRAYGDAAVIGRIVEDADSDIRAIGGALLDVAGPWAKMREAVARGDLARGMDVTPDLLAAVRMVAEARASGRAVAELAQQMGLFGDDLSPTARLLLAGLFRDEALSKPAGRARVAEMLAGYLDEAGKNTAGPRLFGEPLTAEEILRGERMTGEEGGQAVHTPGARPAEEVAAAPETEAALFQEVNRLLAAREVEVPVGEMVDESGRVVPMKRSAMDLMDEADRAINDAATVAACAFGVAAE